jgi:hypothetical protein
MMTVINDLQARLAKALCRKFTRQLKRRRNRDDTMRSDYECPSEDESHLRDFNSQRRQVSAADRSSTDTNFEIGGTPGVSSWKCGSIDARPSEKCGCTL